MIGIFDSGIGGLGILGHVRHLVPGADIAYFADQGNAPYGAKSLSQVSDIAVGISSRLIEMGAATIVVACNTASAAALHTLRRHFPDTTFVGMEPAIKPAALDTRSGVVGVVATAATFQSELYESVVRRFAAGTTIETEACPEWVELVENGVIGGPQAETAVSNRLSRMLSCGADTIVLGCTHFPFLLPVIEKIVGPEIRVVDPAPAVARQVARVTNEHGTGRLRIITTGNSAQTASLQEWLLRLGVSETVIASDG